MRGVSPSASRARPAPGGSPDEIIEVDGLPVTVRGSTRRRKTVQLTRSGGGYLLLVPASMPESEQREWASRLIERLHLREERPRRATDADLRERAGRLSGRHFDGRANPRSVRWVDNQTTRWGSCTPATGDIRISRRVGAFPEYVLDYVLMHELAHLFESGHGPRFWALLSDFPHTERARGFLQGVSWQSDPDAAPPGDDPS